MGTCTSTTRHQRKQHKRTESKNSIILDNKQPSSLPLTVDPNQQIQRPHSLLTNFDAQFHSLTDPIFHKTDTNSLIQLYSPNTNNNNSNIINSMSSSSSASNVPPRIAVPKTRLPVHQSQSSSTSSIRPNITTTAVRPATQIGNILLRLTVYLFHL
jgi:hypothetical protein